MRHGFLRRRGAPHTARVLLRVGVAAAVLVVGVLVPAAWVGVRVWSPAHLRQVTGREDPPTVSCLYCHRRTPLPAHAQEVSRNSYATPAGLALSADGERLFVAASGTDRLMVVATATGQTLASLEIPGGPHGVAVSPDGTRVAVTSRHGDRVYLVDAHALEVIGALPTGPEPLAVAFAPKGDRLYVTSGLSDQLQVVWLDGSPTRGLQAGNEPYALDLAANGSLLVVANRLARPAPLGNVPISELTLVDPVRDRVIDRLQVYSGHLSEGVAVSADGRLVLATVVRVRNLLPLTQVARGAVMNSGLLVAWTGAGGWAVQLPLDRVNEYFADPSGIEMTPDGKLAFIAHAGARTVSVVDVEALLELVRSTRADRLDSLADDLGVSERYVLARIRTRDNPRAMALSPDGRRLYVAERLADSIAVIDTTRLAVIDRFELGSGTPPDAVRRGELVFTDASVTFQSQFSCRSCHPDGHTDGLVWDFVVDGVGRNLVETRSLRGIAGTAPFKWNGRNPDLMTQCGPRFAMVLTRSDPIPPARLSDLVAYIESLPRVVRPLDNRFERARSRGRAIFFRTRRDDGTVVPVAARCVTCHRPPLFTDRLMSDVGTGGSFDTPHLLDVSNSPPFLHDGRARTLEEIWTVHDTEVRHGVTDDLTKPQLNDLIVYLRSL